MTQISRIFRAVLDYIFNTHQKRVTDNLVYWQKYFPELNQAVLQKLGDMGCRVPDNGRDVVGFIDGTIRPTCRPHGRNDIQRNVYNGWKKVHCLKFQAVELPNGLTADIFGPVPGRRNDNYAFRLSMINERLSQLQLHTQRQFTIYGDAAYPVVSHVMRGHKGRNLTAAQRIENQAMSKVREGVEWAFQKIATVWAFTDFKKNLKIFQNPVGKIYIVAAFMKNCHTCLYGSLTSEYFSCLPPSLEEYLSEQL